MSPATTFKSLYCRDLNGFREKIESLNSFPTQIMTGERKHIKNFSFLISKPIGQEVSHRCFEEEDDLYGLGLSVV